MRDPITTCRLLAKIDREIDIYVVADRMRQAIYDLDDYTGQLEKRVHSLEQEKAGFVTDTGLNRKLTEAEDRKAASALRFVRGKVAERLITLGIGALVTLIGITRCGH